jgi:cyclopropane fatty-acyl-phospholipid synthase-like methyltransferase
LIVARIDPDSTPLSAAQDEALRPLFFYERKDLLAAYWLVRDRPDGPKLEIEEPTVLRFLGNLRGRTVLDLGCGDARFGRYALEQGALCYLGLDGSTEMVGLAKQVLMGTAGEVNLQDLESWPGDCNRRFDVVVSQLALQYMENIPRLFEVIRNQLQPHGTFVFSTEHPIITSSYEGENSDGIATSWRVRDYFREGRRVDRWLNAAVVKQHRTLETYVSELRRCGFQIDRFSEGRPDITRFVNQTVYERRLEVPICAIFRCIADS